MRHRQAHQVARVIIEECRHVNALMASQQEREQVRLPQLVGLGPLKMLNATLAPHPVRHLLPLDSFLAQYPAHCRGRRADP